MSEGQEPPTTEQIQAIYRKAKQELAGLNGGQYPMRLREWKAILTRFDVRITTFPATLLPRPRLFYNYDTEVGDLFMPRVHDIMQLRVWLMHEVIELLFSLEFCSQFNYWPHWGKDHDMAVLVHQEYERRFPSV